MRITRTATATVVDGPQGLTLEADLLPWNTIARVSDDGVTHFVETWEPASLIADGAGPYPAFDGHMPTPTGLDHGPLIGRVVPLESTSSHFRGRIELADTTRGRDVHALAALIGADVSIEADTADDQPNEHGVVTRTAANPARLLGVSIELLPSRGAIPGARVTAARTMPTPNDPPTPDPPTPDPDPDNPTIGRAAVDEMIRAAIARNAYAGVARVVSPLARFESLGAAARAAFDDQTVARAIGRVMVGRVLADEVTGDNPGVVHEGWINQVYGIVDAGRPVIAAIGSQPLPSEGMSVSWPVFEGNLLALVGVQAAEKTAITSVKVSLTPKNADLVTYAGGSDISLQLLRRSSPSYLESYLRIMGAAYGAVTDVAAGAALVAAVSAANDNFVVYDPTVADPTGSVLRTAVFSASVKVQAATGSPATVVLMATDVFISIGGALTPPPVQNATGTAQASTLNADVSGLRLVHDPYLPAGTIIVTNGLAASWREDGPMTINALDVEKLGENHAVWGMAAPTITVPQGVVGLVKVAPTARSRTAA